MINTRIPLSAQVDQGGESTLKFADINQKRILSTVDKIIQHSEINAPTMMSLNVLVIEHRSLSIFD